MFPDHWGSDYDYAEAHGNGHEDPPSTLAHPLGRELTAAETAAELHRILDHVLARIRADEERTRAPIGAKR